MTAGKRRAGQIVRWGLRLFLSGLFAYAGVVKMRDAQAFADSVASFRLLPNVLITPTALTLPPFELLAALLALSAGRWGRAGAFCLLTMLLIFTLALVSALARDLSVDCGCFGPDHLDLLSPTKNLWFALGRDLILATMAGVLYVDSRASCKG
ncbi:MAG: DoxX family membrane protein [Rhodospirillales bacterium]|nr:DoxX family membrane protein [Acetobacter sp.]